MGKGDQRSRRGKIWRGTFGKRRPKKSKSGPKPAVAVDNTSPKQEKQKQSRASIKGQEAE